MFKFTGKIVIALAALKALRLGVEMYVAQNPNLTEQYMNNWFKAQDRRVEDFVRRMESFGAEFTLNTDEDFEEDEDEEESTFPINISDLR